MAAGRHFEKNIIAITQPLFQLSAIFTKFGVLVATDSPQRSVMSFLGYNKILPFPFPHSSSFLPLPPPSPFPFHLIFPFPPHLPLFLPSSPSLPFSHPLIPSPLFPFPPRSGLLKSSRGFWGTAVSSPSGVRG